MLTVEPNTEAVTTYKELLLSEWNKSLPQEVLSLLWSTLAGQTSNEAGPIYGLLNPDDLASFQRNDFRPIVQRIEDGTKFVKFTDLPVFPTGYIPPKNLAKIARQANLLTTYLTLPTHTSVGGDTEFFVDLLALAFQAAIHFVLASLADDTRLSIPCCFTRPCCSPFAIPLTNRPIIPT